MQLFLSAEIYYCGFGNLGYNTRTKLSKMLERREILMKVVLVKSPKFLSGILRMLFGIKKENT